MHRLVLAAGAAVGGLALAALGALPAVASPAAPASAASATTTPAHPTAAHATPDHRHHGGGLPLGRPLPAHLDAPYLDVTVRSDFAALSAASGSKDFTLAFLQTPAAGSCTVDWAGNSATPVSTSTYGAEIRALRAAGGDVIPSFGGYSADTTGTELADSCTSVPAIAAEYERVVTTYGVQRLDFDVEADSIANTAGVDRRNQAIALLEQWAARSHRPLTVSYTLPSTPQGLGATGVAVLRSAAAAHADVRIVNAMTFDYYDGAQHDMLADAETAAAGVVAQMQQTIAPHVPAALLYPRVGITQMIGIDDYGPAETFTPDQAAPLVRWATAHRLGELSFWAAERDNGSCVGTKGANLCSGVAQTDWQFSRAFARFGTGGWGWRW